MAFGANKEKKDTPLPKIQTIVAEGTIIKGNVDSSSGTIRIDGTIEGEIIKAHGVIIGENGRVLSDIDAKVTIVSGYVQGNINAKEKLEITSSAKVIGNVKSPSLIISEGSKFEGSCKMDVSPETTSRQLSDELVESEN